MLTIKAFEVNPLQENCYVVSDDTKECMIVDCGAFYPQEIQAITNYILENNLKPVVCALTHGHFDHIYGVRAICDRYAIKPIISQKDEDLYKNFQGKTLRQPFGKLLDRPLEHYEIQQNCYENCLNEIGLGVIGKRLIWIKKDGTYEVVKLKEKLIPFLLESLT